MKILKRISEIIQPYKEAYGPERIHNMTEYEMKTWIDEATYEQLLRKWRFSSLKDPFFQGRVGLYYKKRLREKEETLGEESAKAIGKIVGEPK